MDLLEHHRGTIERERNRLGLSRYRLAKLAGVDLPYLRLFLRGTDPPPDHAPPRGAGAMGWRQGKRFRAKPPNPTVAWIERVYRGLERAASDLTHAG